MKLDRKLDRRVEFGSSGELGPSKTRRSQGDNKGWYSRGYIPHFDAAGLVQHITFHTADSLPPKAVERMEYELRLLSDEDRQVERRRRIHDLLDSGMGECLLRKPEYAQVVEDSLLFGDCIRYRLIAWVIMPNHVHVLIEQKEAWPLAKVVQSWKRHTSRKTHQLMGGSSSCNGPFWQRDYWDRYIRNGQHFSVTKQYVENNPVKAGLVEHAGDWRWGSAYGS
jgi:REP element-mobilizing transposase RayT